MVRIMNNPQDHYTRHPHISDERGSSPSLIPTHDIKGEVHSQQTPVRFTAGGWVLLGFFHNKQDCGGNALSHSIALPLAIDHTHHHNISSYRCYIQLFVPAMLRPIAVLHHFWSFLLYASE